MRAVDAEFVVQVRTGCETGHADITDRFTLMHALADVHARDARHVAVQRAVATAVIDDYDVAVPALPAAERDLAVAGGMDRRAGRRRIVDAAVRAHRAENRMH